MKSCLIAVLLAGLLTLPGFGQEPSFEPVTVNEVFFTSRDLSENVDSPAIWHGEDGQRWIISTTKDTHSLLVEDATNGAFIARVGGLGDKLGQFNRPNGISVVGDLCFVVERDNGRVQILALPDFTPIGPFGEGVLTLPYGLWVQKVEPMLYHAYVTDAAELEDIGLDNDELSTEAQVVAAERDLLARRVRLFEVEVEGVRPGTGEGELLATFGDTDGAGRLMVVESIFGDPEHGRLLIADELMEAPGHNVKIYDLEGNFTGQTIADGLFRGQSEGIALVEGETSGSGYWILSDQGKRVNYFHILDRETLDYLGSFEGNYTLNTDGIWFDGRPLPRHPEGVFYAIHNDGNVAAFDWAEIKQALGL